MTPSIKQAKRDPRNEWQKGYDLGVKNALHQNSEALALGNALLEVLDRRYEPKDEDY